MPIEIPHNDQLIREGITKGNTIIDISTLEKFAEYLFEGDFFQFAPADDLKLAIEGKDHAPFPTIYSNQKADIICFETADLEFMKKEYGKIQFDKYSFSKPLEEIYSFKIGDFIRFGESDNTFFAKPFIDIIIQSFFEDKIKFLYSPNQPLFCYDDLYCVMICPMILGEKDYRSFLNQLLKFKKKEYR